jgi:hypothetical protein
VCQICDSFKKRTGYADQRYAVLYTRDGVESKMGWQDHSSGGLEDAAKLMPGVTATRVAAVECCQIEYGKEHCGGECTCRVCAPDLAEREARAEAGIFREE